MKKVYSFKKIFRFYYSSLLIGGVYMNFNKKITNYPAWYL